MLDTCRRENLPTYPISRLMFPGSSREKLALKIIEYGVFRSGEMPRNVSVIAAIGGGVYGKPPAAAWNIASPIDIVALATFLATSLVITRLASKARIDADSANSKRRDLAQLYELALRLLSL